MYPHELNSAKIGTRTPHHHRNTKLLCTDFFTIVPLKPPRPFLPPQIKQGNVRGVW